MSRQLIDRSPDLLKLRTDGFDIEVRFGYLLVRDIPYVNGQRQVKRGTLIDKLNLAGEQTGKPHDHTVFFHGDYPCHADSSEITHIRNNSEKKVLAEGVFADHYFSAKPREGGNYADYHDKVTKYVATLEGPAAQLVPGITARTGHVTATADMEDEVFRYRDTASSRAEIDLVTDKLRVSKIAIVGLGGTGSYILDLVAKAPVKEIHLFDADTFFQHNAFRAPGAPSIDELRAQLPKATYLAGIYSKMRRGIVGHPEHLSADNVDQLQGMDFVFISMDPCPAKKMLVEKLEAWNQSFLSVGMGLHVGDNNCLVGKLGITTSTPAKRDHFRKTVSLDVGADHNDYATNIQVADLNALNAALAVIKWKKLLGFYADYEQEHFSSYTIELQMLTKEEMP
jgi:hypothetical protein